MTRDRRSGDRADRFAVFPFSMGCISHSAVSVVEQQQKNPQNEVPSTTPSKPSYINPLVFSIISQTTRASSLYVKQKGAEDDGGSKVRGASTSPGIVATGVQRLIKGLKSLSQMFAVYDEEEEDEREMVIGFPTDVKHVGHIGWDGFNKDGGVGMVDAFSMQPSTLSLRQLEMAMEAHACTT